MTSDRGKMIGTYVNEAIAEAVRVRAFEERCSKGEILRRALRAYLDSPPTATGAPKQGGGRGARRRPPARGPRPAGTAAVRDTG